MLVDCFIKDEGKGKCFPFLRFSILRVADLKVFPASLETGPPGDLPAELQAPNALIAWG